MSSVLNIRICSWYCEYKSCFNEHRTVLVEYRRILIRILIWSSSLPQIHVKETNEVLKVWLDNVVVGKPCRDDGSNNVVMLPRECREMVRLD